MFEYSVLMSVYHKESPDFLRTSMQSMFDQTIPPSDFVLVCDGPLTEALDAVIASFQKQHPSTLQVVRLEQNVGLGSALNEGLTHCKYKYVARMDSDDIAMPYRIEKQYLAIRSTGADIISGTVAEFDQIPGDRNTCRKLPAQHDQIREFAKKRNPFNHPCIMFRKETVESVGGYQPFYLLEDYYLWIRLLLAGYQGYNIPEPILYMRVGNGMYARRGGWSYFKTIYRLRKYMVKTKFCSMIDALKSLSVYLISCIIPAIMREKIYGIFLRN